jgi:hypothetical protein
VNSDRELTQQAEVHSAEQEVGRDMVLMIAVRGWSMVRDEGGGSDGGAEVRVSHKHRVRDVRGMIYTPR